MTASAKVDKFLTATSEGRTWWLSERRPVVVNAYRIVLAGTLAIHFGTAVFTTAPWLIEGRLVSPAALASTLRYAMFNGAPLLPMPALTFGTGVALALFVAIGALPRAAAVLLYVLSMVTYGAVLPIATADDYFAILASLTLCVLPVPRSVRSRAAHSKELSIGGETLPAASVNVILACVVGFYLAGGPSGGSGFGPPEAAVIKNGFRVVAVALIVPLEIAQVLGIVLQVGLHAYLLTKTQCMVVNVALAGTSVFFLGERSRSDIQRFRIDAGVVTISMVVLVTVAGVVQAIAAPLQLGGPLRLAVDAGFMPAHLAFREAPDGSVGIWTRREGRVRDSPIDGRDSRSRALRARLGGAAPEGLVAHELAVVVAKRFCDGSGRQGDIGRIISGPQEDVPLLDFKCGTPDQPMAVR